MAFKETSFDVTIYDDVFTLNDNISITGKEVVFSLAGRVLSPTNPVYFPTDDVDGTTVLSGVWIKSVQLIAEWGDGLVNLGPSQDYPFNLYATDADAPVLNSVFGTRQIPMYLNNFPQVFNTPLELPFKSANSPDYTDKARLAATVPSITFDTSGIRSDLDGEELKIYLVCDILHTFDTII